MTHIADPLKMLARAGRDLLSYGLNRYTPSPPSSSMPLPLPLPMPYPHLPLPMPYPHLPLICPCICPCIYPCICPCLCPCPCVCLLLICPCLYPCICPCFCFIVVIVNVFYLFILLSDTSSVVASASVFVMLLLPLSIYICFIVLVSLPRWLLKTHTPPLRGMSLFYLLSVDYLRPKSDKFSGQSRSTTKN
jgi:hypothetical protein